MNWSVKLAKSLRKDQTLQRHHFIQTICQIAIALCICTILLSTFLIRGFEKTIEDKIFSFWSHIRISSISNSVNPIGESPIHFSEDNLSKDGLAKITPVVNKGAILKNQENIEGVILRGIDLDQTSDFVYAQNSHLSYDKLKETPIILSQHSLDKLNLKLGATLFISILDSTPKTLKAKVINTYSTNIEEFDAQIALSDIKFLQNLNQWGSQEYSWVELQANDKNEIRNIAAKLYQELEDVSVNTIFEIYPQLFDWLALMKKNELIIFLVMLVVAMVNIISSISIFVIEKTKLIGMLKVLGAKNKSIIEMMYYQVFFIILKGIVIGNVLALILTAIMHYLKPIKLDPAIYYISYAPIWFDWKAFILINVLTIVTCVLSAYIPLGAISKISPIKVVEFK
jgi:lipoprotein-releasing system permease protein